MFTRLFLFGLSILFGLEILFLSAHVSNLENAPVIFWVLAGFAALRLAHTVSYNTIGEWIRAPFTKVVPDTAGGSESIEPKSGRFEAIGMLLSCPICSGTWSAVFLVTVYALNQSIGLAIVAVLGIAGISENLHRLSELMEWAGRNHREQAGTSWLLKNRGEYVGVFQVEDEKVNEPA